MRALLRRPIWRPVCHPFARYQHDLPHKEYFQNPGQTPLPDATAYTLPRPPPAFPSSPSYFRRALRSVGWATLFGTLGLAGGVSLLTWDYLQPPFEPGSVEDQEMLEEIEEMMNSHPVVQGLREGGWAETTYKSSQARLLQTLSGTQGLTMRGFLSHSTGYTILVFYVGSGLEGWPDVVHGGLITTLFNEAALLRGPNADGWVPPYQTVVDFKVPVRPGEIYTILLPPPQARPLEHEKGPFAQLAVQGMLMRMDEAPEITTEIDDVAQTRIDRVVIPTRSSDSPIFAQATIYTIIESVNNGEEERQPLEATQLEKDP